LVDSAAMAFVTQPNKPPSIPHCQHQVRRPRAGNRNPELERLFVASLEPDAR
jgi:hypothetical protein